MRTSKFTHATPQLAVDRCVRFSFASEELSLVAFAAAKVGGPGNNLAALVLEQLLKLLESHPEKLRELLSLSGVLLAAAKTLDARQTATLLWAVNRCMHHPGRRKAWPPSGRGKRCQRGNSGAIMGLSGGIAAVAAFPETQEEEKGTAGPFGFECCCAGLCNSLLALAAMLGRSEKRHTLFFLEGKMQQHIARRLVGFQPEDLAALASTLALTRGGAPLLQQRLLHVAAEAADTFNATQLSQIVYAFGLLRGSAHLFASLQFPVLERLQQFSVPELCDVVWSFAVARFHEPTFWEKPFGRCNWRSIHQTLRNL
ncbi:uncharacterized protein LOC34624222 [Cyclospora cayetanensis]|uniref:Uncharacterized protein LOC34624222 n=1 Tax=Cyclospora cayetanensis TaxID=88456 RepID=A0A6P6RZN2_9EIME|nr:uncharacterized protein LOC34624222 [Cyclospora cayetanensis]